MTIQDNGNEGIFKKIQRELSLHDERHAILEPAKGKLTTDPTRHSGEGCVMVPISMNDDVSKMIHHVTKVS